MKCLNVIADILRFQTTGLPVKTCKFYFSGKAKQSGGKQEPQLYHLSRDQRAEVVDAINGKTQGQSFKLMCGNISLSACQKMRKGDRQKTICRNCRTATKTHLQHFFSHVVVLKVQSLFTNTFFQVLMCVSVFLFVCLFAISQ